MNRAPNDALAEYDVAQLEDMQYLVSVITAILRESPIDELLLRRGVWRYVGAARHAGRSPGHVIVALTDLVKAARIAPTPAHQTIMRQVILWCVEAHFGHLCGDAVGQDGEVLSDSPIAPGR